MSLEMIDKIADKLGVGASNLIEMYVQRAPLEWIEVHVLGCLLAFSLSIFIGAIAVLVKIHDSNQENLIATIVVTTMFSGAILIVCSIGFPIEFIEAMKAEMAPQAYAVDMVLNKLSN